LKTTVSEHANVKNLLKAIKWEKGPEPKGEAPTLQKFSF